MCASSVRRAICTVWSSATFRLRLAAGAEDEHQSGRYLVDTWRASIVKQGSWRLNSFVLSSCEVALVPGVT